MERYHDRFAHSDLDDDQVHAEMFVNLCGTAYGDGRYVGSRYVGSKVCLKRESQIFF